MKTTLKGLVQDRSDAVQESRRYLLEYIRSNIHRMDYPTYPAKGGQIGFGPHRSRLQDSRQSNASVRAECAGAKKGAPAICHLRALYRSDSC